MDILMEPFFVFFDGSYQTHNASVNSIFRLLTSYSGCVPESYEQINRKRLEENLRSMWKSFTADVSSELDSVALK
jgi:hypothetical protein